MGISIDRAVQHCRIGGSRHARERDAEALYPIDNLLYPLNPDLSLHLDAADPDVDADIRRSHGNRVAVDGASDFIARRDYVWPAVARHAVRTCILQSSGRRLSRRLARRFVV